MNSTGGTPILGQQIPLGLTGQQQPSFELFQPGDNAEALQALRKISLRGEPASVYLWGARGTGKTHLLLAACREGAVNGRDTAYVPLAQGRELSPLVLEGLETRDMVCIDDIDAIAGQDDWEQSIFHLFNRARALERAVVIAGNTAPAGSPLQRAELVTRLAWGLVFQLKPLADEEKLVMIGQRANALGLELSVEVVAYLLKKAPRDMNTLCALIDELDRSSLAAQRRITIPFVRTVLCSQSDKSASGA